MVDVPGGGDHVHRRGHLQHGLGQRVVVRGRQAAQVEQGATVLQVADDRPRAQPQRLGEAGRQRDGDAGQRVLRRPSPADAGRCVDDDGVDARRGEPPRHGIGPLAQTVRLRGSICCTGGSGPRSVASRAASVVLSTRSAR